MLKVVILFLTTVAVVECNWRQFQGTATHLSARGPELWAITRYSNILRWVGDHWVNFPGYANFISAGTNGAWATNWDYHVFVVGSAAGAWTDVGTYVSAVSGTNTSYSAAINSPNPNANGCIIFYRSGTWGNPSWGQDCNNQYVAIGDSGEVWKIDQNGKVYKRDSGGWIQQTFPIPARHVDVQSNSKVVVTDTDGVVQFSNSGNWTSLNDIPVDKFDGTKYITSNVRLNCIMATLNATTVFCLDFHERIWSLDISNGVPSA